MQTNLRDFNGETIYVGIDSHLKSWNVTIMSDEMELRNFTQEPDSKKLSSFLRKHFPGADYRCVYEAGFAGFNAQRSLSAEGINCIVIHPADVPTSDKEKRHKSDRVDSRKLVRGLRNKDFTAIYVPDLQQQQDRTLLRGNDRITRKITRVKCQIKSLLMMYAIAIPKEYEGKKWTNGLLAWLEKVRLGGVADVTYDIWLRELRMLLQEEACFDRQIKLLSEQPGYQEKVKLLMSIPGVGRQTAMVLSTEIGEINRFRTLKQLNAYFGLIPDCHDSGDTKRVGRNTKRGNTYLKYVLIEVSWVAIRHDSSLLLTYKSAVRMMDGNKAIIKVARKLLNRIRFVLKNNKAYEVMMAEENKK